MLRAVSLGLLGLAALGCGGSDDNVFAAPTCTVMGCGGDLVGTWDIEEACIPEEDCADESGTVTGSFTFTADGYNYEWLIQTSGCGFRGESDSGGGGSYRAEGNTLFRGGTDEPIFEYCVEGDVLHLLDLEPSGGERFTLRRAAP